MFLNATQRKEIGYAACTEIFFPITFSPRQTLAIAERFSLHAIKWYSAHSFKMAALAAAL